MLDPRVTQLAELFCSHSMELGPKDSVLVHAFDIPAEAVAEIVRVASSKGAKVAVRMESAVVKRQQLMNMSAENADLIASIEKNEMEHMTAYVALRGTNNSTEQADVPTATMAMWQRHYLEPVVFQTRVPNTKWVVMRWPNGSMAQQAGMSTQAFEDFYFRVCLVDYARMAKACEPLEDLMNRTDQVHILGPGTDLKFSIKDIGAVSCAGGRNIPDGECFSAPVKDSMNGVIQYNTASLYNSVEFKNIRYEVKNGKIVDARCEGPTDRLNEILDTDAGSRYFGEWALGFNPHILHPMLDTLFDEKIAGSFHLTPGNSYPPPGGNGNVSAIHWDTVNIQRPDYGGGEIWFDGKLIRKDGIFTLPELDGLNPDGLGA